MNESTKELIYNVIGDLAEEGFFSEERFIESSVQEVNLHLQELGVLGNRRRFALCKLKEDLEINYRNMVERQGKSVLAAYSPVQRFQQVAPSYVNHLLDEEHAQDLIDVWLEQMVSGALKIPEPFPAMLYGMVKEEYPDWADGNLDASQQQTNVYYNRELLAESLQLAGLT